MPARFWRAAAWGLCLALLAACSAGAGTAATPRQSPAATSPEAGAAVAAPSGGNAMEISSSAFAEGTNIPKKYTCDAENVSPPLAFRGLPAGVQTLALIADDPDAPAGTWVHWVVFNLPAQAEGLPEGVPAGATIASGGQQGTSSFNKSGYGGPCPPSGSHRYYFKLYALDNRLDLTASARAKDVQAAMQGHILAQAQVMGRYQRSK